MSLTRLFMYFWAILFVLFASGVLPVAAAPVCYRLDVTLTNQSAHPIGFVPTFFDSSTGSDVAFGSDVIVAPGQTGAGSLEGDFEEYSVMGGFYYWFADSVSGSDYPTIGVDFTYDISMSYCGGGSADSGMDGRLNGNDPAALVAIYVSPSADDAYDIYTINPSDGQGMFARTVTLAEIGTAKDACTAGDVNTLVADGSGFSLWVIQPCDQLSLTGAYPDGKPYAFLFDIPENE